MHFTNPFTNPPRLPSPSKRRLHSRSPSHSPVRYRARDNDPLLRDLSPSSTLRAFVSDPSEWTESSSNALVRSILTSSHSERALGAKAAQICLDVRSWTREMEHWQWPGTFEVPEPARRKTRTSTLSFGTITSIVPDDEEEEHWGSLPAKTVRAYGLRADEIGQALDRIDVEELKDFVLSSHYRTGSRSTDRGKRSNLKQLDDYTAVITATILQALPYLSRLNRLLDLWTIRLIILQGATTFVRDLQRARMDMDHGWAAIAVSSASGIDSTGASFGRKTMLEMKELIEHQVGSLGRRLDRFLDDLEGREETVPDAWIEDFERLETAYGDWVVQAERKVLENEWRDTQEKATMTRADKPELVRGFQRGEHDVSHTEDPDSDGEAVIRPSIDRPAQITQASRPEAEDYRASAGMIPRSNNADGTGVEWSADNLLPRTSLSDERKSRNVSAVLLANTSTTMPNNTGRSRSQGNQPVSDDLPHPAPIPRSKTAFLDNVDRSNTLMKQSKSPVRSFEHASNAFTRLFKKDKGSEQGKAAAAANAETNVQSSNPQEDNRSVTRGRKPFPAGLNVARRTKSANMDSPKKAGSPRTLFGSDNTTGSGDIPPIPLLMPPKNIPRQRSDPKEPHVGVQTVSTLSSPFHSPKHGQFPEDWPLSTPDSPRQSPRVVPASDSMRTKSEIYSPPVPIETEAFDRMFVRNFPGSSARPNSAHEAREPTRWSEGHRRAKSTPRLKGKSPAVSSRSHENGPMETTLADDRTPLSRIVLPDLGALRPISMVAELSSSLPLKLEVQSEPEQSDQVEELSTPSGAYSILGTDESRQTQKAASVLTQIPAEHDSFAGVEEFEDSEQSNNEVLTADESETERPSLLKRASITSVETFKRADVKSIDVPGNSKQSDRSSTNSPSLAPAIPRSESPVILLPQVPGPEPATHQSPSILPTPPRKSSLGKATGTFRPETPPSRRRDYLPSSPLDDRRERTPEGRVAPLNAAMTKRRGKAPKRKENHTPGVLTLSPSKKGAFFNPEGDTFDRHISEVLETLPSSIRFKTRSGAETPVSDTGEPRGSGTTRPRTARVPPRHNVTIAPAESPPKKSSFTSDNEVKVYHLTQAGSDETIKLFVRLVGESERVMVRVGGGWADLADYLRQYAEHHGSRTMSQGTLEFQPVNGTASRRVSGAAEQKGKQPVTPNPNKIHGNDDPTWLSQSQPRSSIGDGASSDEGDSVVASRLTPSLKTTPMSANGSRPSTANTERPSSRQSASDVRLSGPPSGKRSHLSETKEKWVEGMIERAKQVSTEKSKEENQKYFAELGKAGATRRVIFRSSSAMSNRPNGSDKGK